MGKGASFRINFPAAIDIIFGSDPQVNAPGPIVFKALLNNSALLHFYSP